MPKGINSSASIGSAAPKGKSKDKKIAEFLAELSAASPTPGGGSAAALGGSLAASLVIMVSGLTIGKKDYQGLEADFKKALKEAERLREELLEFIDKDAEAFNKVMAAYKLPRANEEERRKRKTILEEALKEAILVPYQIAEHCFKVLKLVKLAVERGNVNALSDAATAGYLAQAALQAALLNVDTNLNLMTDQKFISEYAEKRRSLAEEGHRIKGAIISVVEAKLKR